MLNQKSTLNPTIDGNILGANQSIVHTLLKKTMPLTTDKKTETKLVEVEFCWEQQVGVPMRYECDTKEECERTGLTFGWDKDLEGTLTFKETELNGDMRSIKIKVPVEATTSKTALKDYILEEYRNSDCDIASLNEFNIWDEKQEKFLF